MPPPLGLAALARPTPFSSLPAAAFSSAPLLFLPLLDRQSAPLALPRLSLDCALLTHILVSVFPLAHLLPARRLAAALLACCAGLHLVARALSAAAWLWCPLAGYCAVPGVLGTSGGGCASPQSRHRGPAGGVLQCLCACACSCAAVPAALPLGVLSLASPFLPSPRRQLAAPFSRVI